MRKKEQLREKIKATILQIRKDEQANLTDPDAKFIRSKQQIDTNYNCQAGITEDGLIVIAFTTNQASDKKQLIPVMEQAEQNTCPTFENILADSGYSSYNNYEWLADRKKNGYLPDQQKEIEQEKQLNNPFHKNHFYYDSAHDKFICPQGKELPYAHDYESKTCGQKSKVYIGVQCSECAYLSHCSKGKARQIHVERRDGLRLQARKLLDSQLGKQLYEKRKRIEAVFGNIKHNLKYHQLHLRGLEKTMAEWQLICLAHNIKLLHRKKAA